MFSSFFSFDHPFVTGVLHGGSTCWFIKDLIPSRSFSLRFFSEELNHSSSCNPECNSFFLHSISSSFLSPEFFMVVLHDQIHSSRVHQDFVGGVQVFFILHSEVQFLLPYLLRWCYVILDNLSSCFMVHMLSTMRYLKSINLFIGVILGYISPKVFPKDCCYLWCL